MKIAKPLSLFASIATLGVVLTSCSAMKVAQCNQLVAVVKEGEAFAQELQATEPKNPQEASQAFKNGADKIDGLTAKLEAVELQDEKLKEFRSRYVEMTNSLTEVFRESADAIDQEDAEALQTALKKLETVDDPEAKLVSELNSYCSGS